jgi:hypothetical protein
MQTGGIQGSFDNSRLEVVLDSYQIVVVFVVVAAITLVLAVRQKPKTRR